MEEIRVTINKSGSVIVDMEGFNGTSCDAVKALEESLGMISRTDKSEYYKNEVQHNQFNTN